MKIAVKELRETYNCLRIIRAKCWLAESVLEHALEENNQLIAIFVKSIQKAQENNRHTS
jgi:hypothetical protein